MFWYLARRDELLIDLDEAMRDTGNGPWVEIFFRRRLREAMLAGKLNVRDVYLTRSATNGHFQAVVRVIPPPGDKVGRWSFAKLTWQLYLGSDLYRARADIMRCAMGCPWPSLLILPDYIPDFYRDPDAICPCEEKHTSETTCGVFLHYRGPEMVEMFGPKAKRGPEKMVPLPLGHIPLELIQEVRK